MEKKEKILTQLSLIFKTYLELTNIAGEYIGDCPLHLSDYGITRKDLIEVSEKCGFIVTKAMKNAYHVKPKKGADAIATVWVAKG